MRRRPPGPTAKLLGSALAAMLLLTACSDGGGLSESDQTVSPTESSDPSETSGTPSPSATSSPSASSSEAPESEEPDSESALEAIDRPSPYAKMPGPLPREVSPVELGRLSVGKETRLAGETFALAVAQYVADTREEHNRLAIIDAIASPQLDEAARDQLLADFESQRGLQTDRHFVTDGEEWMRSGVRGKSSAPRVVQVELAAPLVNGVVETVHLGRVRVDVARRAGRWEVTHVSGPAMRAALVSPVQNLKPLLGGKYWRHLPDLKNGPSKSPGPTPDTKSDGAGSKGGSKGAGTKKASQTSPPRQDPPRGPLP